MSGYNVRGVGMGATTSGQTSITGDSLDDAASIGIYMPSSVSTGISYSISICPTSSGTVFFPVSINQGTTVAAGQVALVMASSQGVYATIEPVTFMQLRITATAANPTFPSWVVTKQIFV